LGHSQRVAYLLSSTTLTRSAVMYPSMAAAARLR
jgi:hypothetical protein